MQSFTLSVLWILNFIILFDLTASTDLVDHQRNVNCIWIPTFSNLSLDFQHFCKYLHGSKLISNQALFVFTRNKLNLRYQVVLQNVSKYCDIQVYNFHIRKLQNVKNLVFQSLGILTFGEIPYNSTERFLGFPRIFLFQETRNKKENANENIKFNIDFDDDHDVNICAYERNSECLSTSTPNISTRILSFNIVARKLNFFTTTDNGSSLTNDNKIMISKLFGCENKNQSSYDGSTILTYQE